MLEQEWLLKKEALLEKQKLNNTPKKVFLKLLTENIADAPQPCDMEEMVKVIKNYHLGNGQKV